MCDEDVKGAEKIWLLYRVLPEEGIDEVGRRNLEEEMSARQSRLGGFSVKNV